MPDEWSPRCPRCGIALIIDAPINVVVNWQDTLARYGFQRVAVCGGWERLGLENTVPIEAADLAACDAVYLGDVITQDTRCPRCQFRIQDIPRPW